MPTTYNGIGTHYYSKRHLETRVNVCQHCGREGTLTSYDTRLWVVIVFIPVFPLERKRIIDQCSNCSYHYAINLQKWHTAGQLEVSGAEETYRTSPTAENAIALHRKLLGFHQNSRADEFQKELAQKFSSNAKVLAYLAASLAHLGKHDQAAVSYQRALEIRPDLPEAKIGMGMELLRQHRLFEAQNMLDILDKPGAGQLYSLEPLELLGNAFQEADRHEDALCCFNRILTELPQAGQHAAFRKKIAKSEKALGRKQSALPKKKFSWRNFAGAQNPSTGPAITKSGLAAFAVISSIIIGAFVLSNYYISGHRKVHVVNGLADRITISIDGGAPFALRPHAVHELIIAEGSHVAKISGAHAEEISFDIREKYFSRWFSDPAWVLNPGGAALLLHEAVTYAKNPIPPIYSFHFGNSFEHFREITHPFQTLPDTIKLPSGSQGVLKTRLSEFREPVSQAFAYLTGENQRADALRLAELFLQRHPTNEDLLDAYVSEIYMTKDFQRALPLLESGLAYRPVQVKWHRTYQSFVEEVHPETNILALYNDFLTKEPTNSALIYLRGRLLESNDESIAEFQRALVLNPTNAYALNALGYNSSAHADWASAKKYFSQAVALDPKNDAFWSLYCQSKLALAEYDSMEIELRERLKTEPHFVTAILLIQLLASQNKAQQAEAEVTALVAHAGGDSPEMQHKLLTPLQRVVAYCSGDFNQLQVLSTNEPTQLHVALVEQNRLAEAEANLPEDFATRQDPFAPVAFGLAWNLAGDPKKGNEWISRGLQLLENGSKDERAVARLLRKTEAPADRELWELTVSPRERAIVAALLRFQHPAESGRFAQWIKRFNVEPIYPYHLLNRIVTRSIAAK